MPIVLPLAVEEVPEISDAMVAVAVLMRASLEAERERGVLHMQLADQLGRQDWAASAETHRRLAAVVPAAARMARVARDMIRRYDTAPGVSPLPDPAMDARIRRGLAKIGPWMEKRWLPVHDEAGPPTEISCHDIIAERLGRYDATLAAWAGDRRPSTLTARRIMVADRNDQAAACRACGGCPLSTAALTDPLPPV